jgi:uncharacterized YigZ family protein
MNHADDGEVDSYLTLEGPGSAALKVQGSKFLGFALPARSREDAIVVLRNYQKEYHDATHHCLAYRCYGPPKESRYQDDGEPAGSAGKPILAAIERAGLQNVAVVVVRYFGGTKLGIGGLVRAYGDTAAEAIARGNVVRSFLQETFTVTFPHALTSPVMRTLSDRGASIIGTMYDERVHLRIEIRVSRASELTAALTEATNGGVEIEAVTAAKRSPPAVSTDATGG